MARGEAKSGTLVSRAKFRGFMGFLAFLAIWEVLPDIGVLPARYFPPFHQVLQALASISQGAVFWHSVLYTTQAWFIGLALAFLAATLVGLLLGSIPVLWRYTESTIEFLRPIPSVALIPLAVLMFGIDIKSALLLIVYASFWQILIQILYGVKDVDPVAMDTARVYGLSRWSRIRHVAWPTALPYAITGFRLGASVALVLAVTAELVIGNPGIGHQVALAQSAMALPEMYALVIVAGIMGVLVNVMARAIERKVLAWHPSVRSEK
ncbi:MAG TPA: ABC transporter permease [Castellaniella sp.]|uniref:ABC transporter permease n=1 Tax=Castellaniella sp. TaxID=1955812 RepID=UPI002EDBFE26